MIWKQADFSAAPDKIFGMLTDESFLAERSRSNGEQNVTAEVSAADDDTIVRMHVERTMELPGFLKKRFHPHQVVEVEERWTRESDNKFIGIAEYVAIDRPVTIKTETIVEGRDGGTRMKVGVSVSASLPVIRKPVEKLVADLFASGVETSFDYLRDKLKNDQA